MTLDSVAAVVGFLLLLAPGIVWQLDRGRYKSSVKETALLEFSRIVLVSLGASVAVAVPLVPLLWLPLLRNFDDIRDALSPDLNSAVLYVAVTVVHASVATALTWTLSRLSHRGPRSIVNERVWHLALSTWHLNKKDDPRLVVELLDGTVWRGTRIAFDAGVDDQNRWIALGPPLKRRRPAEGFKSISPFYQRVLLPEREIKSLQIAAITEKPADLEATSENKRTGNHRPG